MGSPRPPVQRFLANAQQARHAEFEAALRDLDDRQLYEGALRAIRGLCLPGWKAAHPKDVRPAKALEAVEAFLRGQPNGAAFAQAAARACTDARKATLGFQHQVAEAARALAQGAATRDAKQHREAALEALSLARELLLGRLSVEGRYGHEAEVSAELIAAVRGVNSCGSAT